MSLFGFIEEIATATIKISATTATGVADIVEGELTLDNTQALIESAGEDIADAIDEITDL